MGLQLPSRLETKQGLPDKKLDPIRQNQKFTSFRKRVETIFKTSPEEKPTSTKPDADEFTEHLTRPAREVRVTKSPSSKRTGRFLTPSSYTTTHFHRTRYLTNYTLKKELHFSKSSRVGLSCAESVQIERELSFAAFYLPVNCEECSVSR